MLLAARAPRAPHLAVPFACLPTCTSSPGKACADDHWKVSFCHVGFSESSSALLQRANSPIPAGAQGSDRWKCSGLSARGLRMTAPADRYVPDTSTYSNILRDRPTKGKLFEHKINSFHPAACIRCTRCFCCNGCYNTSLSPLPFLFAASHFCLNGTEANCTRQCQRNISPAQEVVGRSV